MLVGAIHSLGCKIEDQVEQPTDEALFIRLDARLYRGQTVTFGANVYQKIRSGTGTWCLFYNDGTIVPSSAAPAVTGYQWAEFTFTVNSAATFLNVGLRFKGSIGDTYYVANPVLAVTTPNAVIGPKQYIKPREMLIPVVHISPWINLAMTFPAIATISDQFMNMFDLYADSGSKIARTVLRSEGCIEGVNYGNLYIVDGPRRIIGFADNNSSPVKYGALCLKLLLVRSPSGPPTFQR